MDSNGKVAVITGAGSGIGRTSTLLLLKDGYSVALAGRREEPLKETIELAGEDGSRAIAVSTDVGDPKSIANLFDQVKDTFGRLDVLFNNEFYYGGFLFDNHTPIDKVEKFLERHKELFENLADEHIKKIENYQNYILNKN